MFSTCRLTDVERRQMDGMGPPGLIRPLPTRGLPPLGNDTHHLQSIVTLS